MESPEGWDLLISSLAVCDLQKPAAVWAFLALQGLVRDLPCDRIAFFKIVHKVRTQSPSTNSSRARRIAQRLRLKGIPLAPSDTPDPKGEIALQRRQLMDIWAKSFVHAGEKPPSDCFKVMPPESVQKMFTLCSHCYQVYELSEKHVCAERREAEQTGRTFTQVNCGICHATNRPEAQFCRGCGTRFLARFRQMESDPVSSASSPALETDGCSFNVLNVIRDLKATSGLLKKKANKK